MKRIQLIIQLYNLADLIGDEAVLKLLETTIREYYKKYRIVEDDIETDIRDQAKREIYEENI